MIYALDANTISYILRDKDDVRKRWRHEEQSGNQTVIPLIAFYEVRRGLLANNATTKMNSFVDLCKVMGVSDMGISDMEKASEIYATLKNSGQLIDDADILIAAQCIVNGFTLITNNTRHFERIEGLQFTNWRNQA